MSYTTIWSIPGFIVSCNVIRSISRLHSLNLRYTTICLILGFVVLNWNRNLSIDLTEPGKTCKNFNWERNLSIDLTDPRRGLRLTLTGIEIRGILVAIRLTQTKVLKCLQIEKKP